MFEHERRLKGLNEIWVWRWVVRKGGCEGGGFGVICRSRTTTYGRGIGFWCCQVEVLGGAVRHVGFLVNGRQERERREIGGVICKRCTFVCISFCLCFGLVWTCI